jgi:hypothetical protein
MEILQLVNMEISAIGDFAIGEHGDFSIGDFAIGDNLETHFLKSLYSRAYARQGLHTGTGTRPPTPDTMQEGQNEPYALPCEGLVCRCYTVKFKLCGSYVLSLSIDKPNTAIYVSYKTLNEFDLSKYKFRESKMFYIKHSLSPSCMRAIFRSEQIQYPTKKILVISEAVFMFHIKHMLYITPIKSICLYSCRASVMV